MPAPPREARSAPADEDPRSDTVQLTCAFLRRPVQELIKVGVWRLLDRPNVAQTAVLTGAKP